MDGINEVGYVCSLTIFDRLLKEDLLTGLIGLRDKR